jgi:hypothetical protein
MIAEVADARAATAVAPSSTRRYRDGMACVRPAATPNPDAMKFTLDVTLPARMLADRGDEVDDVFTRAVLAIDGVASVFGVNDFVTVTRVHGADWAPIVDAVEGAAARHLPSCPADPSTDAVDRSRQLLRDASRRPSRTAVEIPRRAR